MLTVGSDILLDEFSANRSSRHHVVVTVVTTPLRKVIRDIKCRRRRRSILIIDKADSLIPVLGCGGTILTWENDDIRTKKVAVGENKLCMLVRVYQENIVKIPLLSLFQFHRPVQRQFFQAPSGDYVFGGVVARYGPAKPVSTSA